VLGAFVYMDAGFRGQQRNRETVPCPGLPPGRSVRIMTEWTRRDSNPHLLTGQVNVFAHFAKRVGDGDHQRTLRTRVTSGVSEKCQRGYNHRSHPSQNEG
jgi:hypothetical protein